MMATFRNGLCLLASVIGMSFSAPLVVLAYQAPALSIAFWRTLFATVMCSIIVLIQSGLKKISTYLCLVAAFSGIALGLHLATWIVSLRMTSVSAATALVCTTPLWSCIFSVLMRDRLSRVVWIGVLVAIVGVFGITGFHSDGSAQAFKGDVLALCGGLCMACYVQLGASARRELSPAYYAAICYGVATIVLGILCATTHATLYGWSRHCWYLIAAITCSGQLCGHFLLAKTLGYFPTTLVSIATIFEIPGAAILSTIFLHETLSWENCVGMLVMLCGLIVVIVGNNSEKTSRTDRYDYAETDNNG